MQVADFVFIVILTFTIGIMLVVSMLVLALVTYWPALTLALPSLIR